MANALSDGDKDSESRHKGTCSETTTQLDGSEEKCQDFECTIADESSEGEESTRNMQGTGGKDEEDSQSECNSTRTTSISPMAASLLRERLGRRVVPTHTDPKKDSLRAILSPADSRALLGLSLPLRAPDELLGYRSPRTVPQKGLDAAASTSPVSVSSSSVGRRSPRELMTPVATPVGAQSQWLSPRPQYQYPDKACIASCITDSFFTAERSGSSPKNGKPQFRRRKRAVLIGISYRLNKNQRTYTRHPESVQKWYDVLVRWFGFLSNEIWILTDTPKSVKNGDALQSHATPEHIRDALGWLIDDAAKGDQLILTYSGDTGVQLNNTNQFNPGHHGFVPQNYPEGDIVWDDVIYKMIKALNPSVNLTIFLDCKLSWNLIRLPFIYSASKRRGQNSTALRQGYLPESMQVIGLTRQAALAIKNLSTREREKMGQALEQEQKYFEQRAEEFKECATVVCFAASPTKYTLRHKMKVVAARKLEHGDYVSAAVDAIENMMRWGRQLTYRHLMNDMADALSPPGALQRQVPQLCATHEINLDEVLPVFF